MTAIMRSPSLPCVPSAWTTAALDAETEHQLFEQYASRARQRAENGSITILVSHRSSTVRMADLIVVMDGPRSARTTNSWPTAAGTASCTRSRPGPTSKPIPEVTFCAGSCSRDDNVLMGDIEREPRDGRPVVVSIIDDHPDMCYGVLARLPKANSMFVAGVGAATVAEFLASGTEAETRSDIVLLDLTLKDDSSPADNVALLKNAGYPVVIYTGEERAERLQGTLGIGAAAVVRKEEASCLEEALQAVLAGDDVWVSPLMAEVVLAATGPALSPAQVETLRLYATGVPARQIASARHVSEATVSSHLKAVKERYQAHGDAVYTRTDLLRVALRDRVVGPDWFLRQRP